MFYDNVFCALSEIKNRGDMMFDVQRNIGSHINKKGGKEMPKGSVELTNARKEEIEFFELGVEKADFSFFIEICLSQ